MLGSILIPTTSLANNATTCQSSEALERAKELVSSGMYEDARACAQAARKVYPKDRDLAYYEARIAAMKGDRKLALRIIKTAPGFKNDFETLDLQGDVYWYTETPNLAAKYYQKAVRKFPTEVNAHIKLLKAYNAAGKKKEGKAHWQRYREDFSNDQTYIDLGREYAEEAEPDRSWNVGLEADLHQTDFSDEQWFKERRLALMGKWHDHTLILQQLDLQRQFAKVPMDDQLRGFQLYTSRKHLLYFEGEYLAAADPQFVYEKRYNANLGLQRSRFFASLGGSQFEGNGESSLLFEPILGMLWRNHTLALYYYHGVKNSTSRVTRLDWIWEARYVLTNLKIGYGSDDAARPYLSLGDRTDVTYAGLKFKVPLMWGISGYVEGERRFEKNFSHTMYGGGLAWIF